MITVQNGNDSGVGSLRQAILDLTPGGGIIDFNPIVVLITLTTGELVINADISIVGPGPGSLTVQNTAVSSRVFNLAINRTISISGITVTGGNGAVDGGGIISSANATLTNMVVNGNSATSQGGGIFNQNPDGNMTLTDMVISGNSAVLSGGGFFNESIADISNSVIINNTITGGNLGGAGVHNGINGNLTINRCIINSNSSVIRGGGVHNRSILSINNTTINGNSAQFSGGGFYNHFSAPDTTATITNTTISNNDVFNVSGSGSGGGVDNDAGAAVLNMVNSTISNNSAFTNGGGMRINSGVATLINITISYNSVGAGTGLGGGGIIRLGTSTVNIGNTIVGNNTTGSGANPDVSGTFASQGNNLIGFVGTATGFSAGSNDILNTPPNIGILANNGGPTLTIMPNPGSPAIDNGNNALIAGFNTDQRGYIRIITGIVEIGAVEFGSVPICFSGKSIVLTRNILTNEVEELMVKYITSDKHEVFSIRENQFVPIKLNIVTGPTTRYMKIKKNALGVNQPNVNFYVTSGHKIVINGVEIKAKNIPQAKRIRVKPEYVYSICIEKRGPIVVNGLQVIAWGYDDWLKYADKTKISWHDNQFN